MAKDPPWCPPIVRMSGGGEIAYLIAWEYVEGDGKWSAWVTWPRERGGRPARHVVLVPADYVEAVDEPGAYRQVPRRHRDRHGVIRPWRPGAS
jgi:hypothetical protein